MLVVGAGGLGSPALLYLAAAGVGTIGVIDDDVVENTNLQRQIIHTDARIGMPKVFSAEIAMKALNPYVAVRPYHRRLTRRDRGRSDRGVRPGAGRHRQFRHAVSGQRVPVSRRASR